YLDGNSGKVEYYHNFIFAATALQLTGDKGEYQDLITWEQLSDAARNALIEKDWGTTLFDLIGAKMPLKDQNFNKTLKAAFPF
ncbi:hypothetical protein PHYSODRAFT_509491, partial [Phytophthora sojae]